MTRSKTNNKNNMCILSDLSELSRLRKFIHERASISGFSDEDSNKISLAVDEACTNLIKHSFNSDNSEEICISIESEKDQFIIEILDNGNPFNMNAYPNVQMDDYLKKMQTGGLGIHIIRSVMDEISYIPSNSDEESNTLKMKKFIN